MRVWLLLLGSIACAWSQQQSLQPAQAQVSSDDDDASPPAAVSTDEDASPQADETAPVPSPAPEVAAETDASTDTSSQSTAAAAPGNFKKLEKMTPEDLKAIKSTSGGVAPRDLCSEDFFKKWLEKVSLELPGALGESGGFDQIVKNYLALPVNPNCPTGPEPPLWPESKGEGPIINLGQGTTGTKYLDCIFKKLQFETASEGDDLTSAIKSQGANSLTETVDTLDYISDNPSNMLGAWFLATHQTKDGNRSFPGALLTVRNPLQWAKDRLERNRANGAGDWEVAPPCLGDPGSMSNPTLSAVEAVTDAGIDDPGWPEALSGAVLTWNAFSACLATKHEYGFDDDHLLIMNLYQEDVPPEEIAEQVAGQLTDFFNLIDQPIEQKDLGKVQKKCNDYLELGDFTADEASPSGGIAVAAGPDAAADDEDEAPAPNAPAPAPLTDDEDEAPAPSAPDAVPDEPMSEAAAAAAASDDPLLWTDLLSLKNVKCKSMLQTVFPKPIDQGPGHVAAEPLTHCDTQDAVDEFTVDAYPRWGQGMFAAGDSMTSEMTLGIERELQIRPSKHKCGYGKTKDLMVPGLTYIVSRPPSHAYHFFAEWLYSLFVMLDRQDLTVDHEEKQKKKDMCKGSKTGSCRQTDGRFILFMGGYKAKHGFENASQLEASQIPKQHERLLDALLKRYDVHKVPTHVYGNHSVEAVCYEEIQVGMRSSMDVGLQFSSCIDMQRWKHAPPGRNPSSECPADFDEPMDKKDPMEKGNNFVQNYFEMAQAKTNCTATHEYFDKYRAFIDEVESPLREGKVSAKAMKNWKAGVVKVRASDSKIGKSEARKKAGATQAMRKVLLINRNSSRTLHKVSTFADSLSAELGKAYDNVEVVVTDFDDDENRTAWLMQDADALVAVHGMGLTTAIMGNWSKLRAIVQLFPGCMSRGEAYESYTFDAMAHLNNPTDCTSCVTLCCECADAMGLSADKEEIPEKWPKAITAPGVTVLQDVAPEDMAPSAPAPAPLDPADIAPAAPAPVDPADLAPSAPAPVDPADLAPSMDDSPAASVAALPKEEIGAVSCNASLVAAAVWRQWTSWQSAKNIKKEMEQEAKEEEKQKMTRREKRKKEEEIQAAKEKKEKEDKIKAAEEARKKIEDEKKRKHKKKTGSEWGWQEEEEGVAPSAPAALKCWDWCADNHKTWAAKCTENADQCGGCLPCEEAVAKRAKRKAEGRCYSFCREHIGPGHRWQQKCENMIDQCGSCPECTDEALAAERDQVRREREQKQAEKWRKSHPEILVPSPSPIPGEAAEHAEKAGVAAAMAYQSAIADNATEEAAGAAASAAGLAAAGGSSSKQSLAAGAVAAKSYQKTIDMGAPPAAAAAAAAAAGAAVAAEHELTWEDKAQQEEDNKHQNKRDAWQQEQDMEEALEKIAAGVDPMDVRNRMREKRERQAAQQQAQSRAGEQQSLSPYGVRSQQQQQRAESVWDTYSKPDDAYQQEERAQEDGAGLPLDEQQMKEMDQQARGGQQQQQASRGMPVYEEDPFRDPWEQEREGLPVQKAPEPKQQQSGLPLDQQQASPWGTPVDEDKKKKIMSEQGKESDHGKEAVKGKRPDKGPASDKGPAKKKKEKPAAPWGMPVDQDYKMGKMGQQGMDGEGDHKKPKRETHRQKDPPPPQKQQQAGSWGMPVDETEEGKMGQQSRQADDGRRDEIDKMRQQTQQDVPGLPVYPEDQQQAQASAPQPQPAPQQQQDGAWGQPLDQQSADPALDAHEKEPTDEDHWVKKLEQQAAEKAKSKPKEPKAGDDDHWRKALRRANRDEPDTALPLQVKIQR